MFRSSKRKVNSTLHLERRFQVQYDSGSHGLGFLWLVDSAEDGGIGAAVSQEQGQIPQNGSPHMK